MGILQLLLLFGCLNILDGKGCFHDPKVYIVKVTREEQRTHLITAWEKCIQRISQEEIPKHDTNCNSTFDGIMCWSHGKAGVTAKQPCPNYINNFNTKAYATRVCLPNGEWYINPNTNRSWTNFTECMKHPPPQEQLYVGLEHINRIQLMYRIGYGFSFVSLVIAIFLMVFFKKLHCHRNTIHLNLFVSFALRAVVIFIKDAYVLPDGLASFENDTTTFNASGSNWSCKLVSSIFHYLLVANYMWIFNEGLYLHTLLFVSTFKPAKIFYFCILFGWLSPMLCIIPWVLVRRFLENTLCWNTHNPDLKYDWILRGPIVVSIFINFVLFVKIVRVLFTKLTAFETNNPHRYRRLARSTLLLIPLFGVYYMISVAMPDCMEQTTELVWLYVESGINSFQGFLVAFLFCFANGEVRTELAKRWNRHMLRRMSTVSARSTRTMSIGSSVFVKEKMSPSVMYKDSMVNDQVLLKPLNGHVTDRKDSSVNNNHVHQNGRTVTICCDDEKSPMIVSSSVQ